MSYQVLTQGHLQAILPECQAGVWIGHVSAGMAAWGINTPKRQAMFLAQIGVQSEHLTSLQSSMNYSTEGLMGKYARRFADRAEAARYAHKPQDIANRIFAHYAGNGDEASGDGWRFRPRGLMRLCGRKNYRLYGEANGRDVEALPDLLLDPKYAADSAAWFFAVRIAGIEMADKGLVEACTRAVCGSLDRLEQRTRLYEGACRVLQAW